MDNPAGGRQRPSSPEPRGAILGLITRPGSRGTHHAFEGSSPRALESAGLPGGDSDAATLLTSELATNAIVHTDSGRLRARTVPGAGGGHAMGAAAGPGERDGRVPPSWRAGRPPGRRRRSSRGHRRW
jgi:hypothetical protein